MTRINISKIKSSYDSTSVSTKNNTAHSSLSNKGNNSSTVNIKNIKKNISINSLSNSSNNDKENNKKKIVLYTQYNKENKKEKLNKKDKNLNKLSLDDYKVNDENESNTSKSLASNEFRGKHSSNNLKEDSSKTDKDEELNPTKENYQRKTSSTNEERKKVNGTYDGSFIVNENRPTVSDNNTTEKNFYSTYQRILNENNSLQSLFSKEEKDCLLSQRLINDELVNFHIDTHKTEYTLISEVKEKNDNLEEVDLRKFLEMNSNCVYNLMSFIYDEYNSKSFQLNKILYSKINYSITKIFQPILNKFKEEYKEVLRIEAYKFKCKNFVYRNKSCPLFNLIIKVKIISKLIGKCFEFGYKYKNKRNEKEYENIWKFDLKKKNANATWFSSEVESFRGIQSRFCFSQPILTLAEGDYLYLNVNIFSKNNQINPYSLIWKPLIIEESPKGFYQKSLIKSPYEFDPLRSCEIETMVRFWRTEDEEIKDLNLIKEFKKIFGRVFTIDNIFFDTSKIRMFKFIMKAKNEGKIPKNKFCNFDLEIIPYDNPIVYEVQSVFLLNSYFLTNKIQLRKGINVIFYIIDNL